MFLNKIFNGTIVKYVYGNGLISSYETKANTTEYQSYSYDLRGSVTSVSDENGSITAEYTYSTYGERTVIEGEATVLGYCARDGVLTEANGLIYMRARYYSTELMRFINEDIITGDISNSNSLNRYAYVQGNPATMIDPFGLDPERAKARENKKILDGFKTLAGCVLLCVPGMEGLGIVLIVDGVTGLVLDVVAEEADLNPKTMAIVEDCVAIGEGVVSMCIPGGQAYGASQIGVGVGGLAGGYGSEGIYQLCTGEKSENAFVLGHSLGNIAGDFAGSAAWDYYEFNKYMNLANTLDVSTPTNSAVFYSGPGNRQRALEFAEQNGKYTLETTTGGEYLDSLQLYDYMKTTDADAIWRRMSERYAERASGNVYGFVNGSRSTSIFNTVEYPTLTENKNVTNIFTELMNN